MTTTDERVARLLRFCPGARVRAVETIVCGTGEQVPEGSVGYVQRTHAHDCSVTVAWEGLLSVTQTCSVESLEPAAPVRDEQSARGYVGGGRHEPGGMLDPYNRDKG